MANQRNDCQSFFDAVVCEDLKEPYFNNRISFLYSTGLHDVTLHVYVQIKTGSNHPCHNSHPSPPCQDYIYIYIDCE